MRLEWDDDVSKRSDWDDWRFWTYVENLKEHFEQGELTALIAKTNYLTLPEEYGLSFDKDENFWVVYKNTRGEIILARSNTEYTDWEHRERLLFVPSGSTNPSLAFDDAGRYVVAVEFLPAGATQKEIWIYEYPYSGAGIRRIVDGQHPLLVSDRHGEVILFYQMADQSKIQYRRHKDGFSGAIDVPANDLDVPFPAGFRTVIKQFRNYLEYYYAFFSRGEEIKLPRYLLTEKVTELDLIKDSVGGSVSMTDFEWSEYAFFITFTFVDLFTQIPIVGATVSFRGKDYITDGDGKIDFGKIGAYPDDEIFVTHPDYPDAVFEFQIREDRDFVFEVMGDLVMRDTATGSLDVNVTWESMLRKIDFKVYSKLSTAVEGATFKLDGREVITNGEGIATFDGLKGGEPYFYTLTHPDFDWVTEGAIIIPEENTTVPIQIYNDPPSNHPKDIAESSLSMGIEWLDARYEVTIVALDHVTGQALVGSEVQFNGETKLTDSEGKAVFEKVPPYPLVTNYEVIIDGQPRALIRVTGHESTRQITVSVQVGAETAPLEIKDSADRAEGSVTLNSILWVEV